MAKQSQLTHIVLADGVEDQEVPTMRNGHASGLILRRFAADGGRRVYPVVPDDSTEPGVGETLSRALVAAGKCDACGPKGGVEKAVSEAIRTEAAERDARMLEEARKAAGQEGSTAPGAQPAAGPAALIPAEEMAPGA